MDTGYWQRELEQLQLKRQFWQRNGWAVLYIAIALTLLFIGSLFNSKIDLGDTGRGITLVFIIGFFGFYWLRREQDQTDWKRESELEELLKGANKNSQRNDLAR